MAQKANIALLDWAGLLLAIAMGAVVAIFGTPSFLALMLIFLVLSVVVTRYGHERKRDMGLYEHERSWENVLANGLIPTACAVAYTSFPGFGWGAYVGALAAITADKFASELGVLGGEPVSLLNFKKVKAGRNGAVTPFGLLMSFDGALLMGLSAMLFIPGIDLWRVVAIGLVGFGGSLTDSIVGVLEERGIGNKATTNAICSLFGAVVGFAFL
jgi:uncharacterized protein (TIGR00297 family)